MLAAIAVREGDVHSVIPETLAEAGFLLVQELEDGSVLSCRPVAGEGDAVEAASKAGCRALICGQISPQGLSLLQQRHILCYEGYLYQARQVRRLLYTGVLPVIK